MKRCSKCGQIKPYTEFQRDSSKKDGYRYRCKLCENTPEKKEKLRKAALAYYHRNLDKYAQYREDNREICRERVAKSYRKNREARLDYSRRYYEENKELLQIIHKEYDKLNPEARRKAIKKWRQKNPGYLNSIIAKRRAVRKQATPKWADFAKIRQFYIESKRLSDETGILHAVDHIIPLQHPMVCGLHVETNLQILTVSDNCKKSNSFNGS